MSNVQIDNRVAALLKAGSADFANSEPNTGQGLQGEWPPAGDHDLYVVSCQEKIGKYKDGGAGREVECVEVQFEYEWIRDEKDPSYVKGTPNLIFKGERFQLVPNANSSLTDDGAKTKARINWERFMGHVSKILSITKEQAADPLSRLTELKARINSSTRLAVQAKIDYRSWTSKDNKKSGINKTEYITANISG